MTTFIRKIITKSANLAEISGEISIYGTSTSAHYCPDFFYQDTTNVNIYLILPFMLCWISYTLSKIKVRDNWSYNP